MLDRGKGWWALAVLALGWLLSGPAAGQTGEGAVERIGVEGSQRIEAETVRSYMTFKRGDAAGEEDVDKSLKALFSTGLFADVTIRREGGSVIVRVVENPIINRIAFEGNKRVEDTALRQEIRLRPRVVYTRSRVQADVQRILEIYRRSGRFAVRVVPKVIQLPQNRVNLAFEIDEGSLTGIRSITFIGNRRFSDSELRGAIETKESAFWRFLSGGDSYDPDRLTFDRELLRRKYLSEGYADFRVVSAVAELAPDRGAFFITFTVEEGERYKFGKVEIVTALRDLDPDVLERELGFAEGNWYDADAVERTTGTLSDAAGRAGYAFVDVRPRVRRKRDERRINITFNIQEGPRVFVERIEIRGNVRTQDRVLRREFRIVEGDAFNTEHIRRARRALRNLGFFTEVEVKNVPGSAPDRTVIEIDVKEQSTGEISFGAGFSSTGGVLGEVTLRERNLVGRGQDLRLRLQLGQRQQQIDLGFTQPYFLDRNLTAGFDVFRTARDFQDESSFDREAIGFRLRAGYLVNENVAERWRYTLRRDNVTDIDAGASQAIQDQAGKSTVSAIGHILSYDTRDSRFDTRDGVLISLDNEIAGLGGTERFLKNEVSARSFIPLTEDLTAVTRISGGYIFGLGDDVRILDRFFMGGDDLRGFTSAGVGPRDERTGDAVGGKWFYGGTLGISFPLGLPNEFGIRGRVFSDFGILGGAEGRAAGDRIRDTGTLRMSVGFGIGWRSLLGPIDINFAKPVIDESFDETELIHFSFGARL